jgi:hypothetical protein
MEIASDTKNIPVSGTETLFMQVSTVCIKDVLLSQNKGIAARICMLYTQHI